MNTCWQVGAAAALALLASAAHGAMAAPARVTVDSGVLVGAEADGVRVFKAIPYAAPPAGDLRWAPPAAPESWTGERAADKFSPICPQPVHPNGEPNAGGASGAFSEDCLYLNVWAPAAGAGAPAKGAPVMVWLHGGGNLLGAGSLGAYDGSAFARDGVILVTLNYRLGALGFFAHPALTKAAAPGEPLVAYGLMDQIAALKWVRRNIAAFGGDPANVTLFGESAGGEDALALMATTAARGLFARVIVESGGGWSPPVSLAKAEARGKALAAQAGAPANATAAQLRALPFFGFLSADEGDGAGPAVDGRLFTASVSQTFAAGKAAPVPLMIGSNSWEASLMTSFKLTPAAVLAQASPAVLAAYASEPTDKARAEAIFTDSFMGAPARWVAAQTSGGPSRLYRFAYVLSVLRGAVPGVGHDMEIPFVFDSWDHLGDLGKGLKLSDEDRAMTALVHSCWVSFARTGVPVCAGAPAWPGYTRAADTLMDFDMPATLKTGFNAARYTAQQAAILPTLGLGK